MLEKEIRNVGQTIETIEVNNDYDEQITFLVGKLSRLKVASAITWGFAVLFLLARLLA